jgi:hypothetical protein
MTNENLPVKRSKVLPYSIRYDTNILSQHDEITVSIPHWAWAEALLRARKERPSLFEEGEDSNLKTLAVVLLYLEELLFTR